MNTAAFGPTSERVALVTGASGGIGQACFEALARQGCSLALQFNQSPNDVTQTCERLRTSGLRVEIFQFDLSNPETAGQLVDAVSQRLGGPSILIHAAGSMLEKPVLFTKPEEFQTQLQLHALSALTLCRRMTTYMREKGSGRIVMIGSLAGCIGLGNAAAYAAAKGALHGLTRALALELAAVNATANAIAPGFIDTKMTAGQDAKRKMQHTSQIPLGRYGTPDEIAALASFLCSEAASYITGQILIADGGLSLNTNAV